MTERPYPLVFFTESSPLSQDVPNSHVDVHSHDTEGEHFLQKILVL